MTKAQWFKQSLETLMVLRLKGLASHISYCGRPLLGWDCGWCV